MQRATRVLVMVLLNRWEPSGEKRGRETKQKTQTWTPASILCNGQHWSIHTVHTVRCPLDWMIVLTTNYVRQLP